MSLDRYLAGEDGCLSAAITESIPLADRMVVSFMEKAPGFTYLEDDLKAELYLKLAEAIPLMRGSQGGAKHNPKGYLSKTLYRHINIFLDGHLHFDVPDKSRRRAFQKGKAGELPSTMNVFEEVSPFQADKRVTSERSVVELRMTIDECCRSRDELMIVDMRAKGYTQEEIEAELGIDQVAISRMLSEIQERVEKALA